MENQSWAEIHLINNLNNLYKLFLSKFIYYLESAFSVTYYKKKAKSIRWITKGMKVSCHRMRFLNNLKRNPSSTSEVLNYINRYHLIYKKSYFRSQKYNNNSLVKSSKYSTKVMWQLIKKHMGKLYTSNQDIGLKTDSGKIRNPQTVVDTLKSFYIDCIEDLIQNKSYINGQTAQMKIKYNPNTMFVYPVTEDKLNRVVSKLKDKSTTGFEYQNF